MYLLREPHFLQDVSSMPIATVTPFSKSTLRGATPLFSLRFELGLEHMAVPVSARISISDSVSHTP